MGCDVVTEYDPRKEFAMEAKRTLPLQDAVSRIFDGSSILLFPGHESAALAFEIVRQGRKDLTIITSSYCFSVDL